MSKFKKLLIFIVIVAGAAFLAPHLSLAAVDPGLSTVDGSLNLGSRSPLEIVMSIINFALGFLGFIAVCFILWAGFLWMTSGGNEEKIATAKNILKNGAIGLLIILSAWGITYFIITRIISATGGTVSGGDSCTNGSRISCGCGGEQTCNSGSWGPCLGSTCNPYGNDTVSCDGNAVLGACQADNNLCGADYLCDSTDCICKPKLGLGQSCDATPGGQCNADNNLCGPYLKCDTDSCLCAGPPVITGISPVGGFCSNDENRACNVDADCLAGAACNTTTPNGAANNFLTIYGYNFNSTLNAADQPVIKNNFDNATAGGLSTSWRAETKSGAKAVVSAADYRSEKQSLLIHQDKDLVWPGQCGQNQCSTIAGCTWNAINKTCSFSAKDECKKTLPAVYNEGETLCYPNANLSMSAKLYYDVTPLNLQVGKTYSIQFYYKGKTASNLSLSFGDNQCLGYGSAGALKSEYSWNGSNLSPTPGSSDPCNVSYGGACADQSNTCCANAPYQKKCYAAIEMSPITSGSYSDWKLYSYTIQYTPEMDTWLNKSGQKKVEFIISTSYAATGGAGTDLYIDDFSISKISEVGQVTFLGANSSQAQVANYPKTLNANCVSSWTDRQIIIAIPNGAANGPLQVSRENSSAGNVDVTNDEIGPKIANFIKNNIVRPGLCSVSPTRGLLGDKVVYQGVNLRSGEAYFGDYSTSYKGINSNFVNDNLTGQTLAPSIMPGKTTTFVEGAVSGVNQKSNTLAFIKDQDPEKGPYISSFDPVVGQAGQYVTIFGGGFGNTRGSRQVYFGDKEAVYDFPEVCTNSVWSNDQIIVKVPAGLSAGPFQLKVNLGEAVISSALLSPSTFKYDATVPLKTGLCKIDPILGQVGSKVNLWGEYFGSAGTQASVVFNSNKSTSSLILKDNTADKIETVVPMDSITGPVYVLKNGEWGNALNFSIGKCTKNEECSSSSPVCCPGNTYKTGTCAASLVSCYFDIPNSVYETAFNTGYNSATSTPFDSCSGMAKYFGSCQTGQFCPNSPGKCSPFNPQIEVVGTCGTTFECGALNYCKTNQNNCTYNKDKDVCVANSCQLAKDFDYSLVDKDGKATNFKGQLSCKEYNGKLVKHLNVKTTCPAGWVKTTDGFCANPTALCENCPSEFSCQDDGSGDDIGSCQSTEICASSAYCGQNPNNLNQYACLQTGNKSCDCCCEIGKDTECCAPLKCAGTCGSDQTNDGTGYGSCSGCADVGTTAAQHDAACNCSTASGKFCDISKAGGICVDCAALDEAGCSEHSAQCCFDSAKKTCQGGDGTILPGGKCAYYDCDATLKNTCNNTATTTGQFIATSTCATTCAKNPQTICDLAGSDSAKCSSYDACCFDGPNNKCVNGLDKITNNSINYCAKYDCLKGDANSCKVGSITGAYLGAQNCFNACNDVQPGASCASDKPGTCDISVCGNPYSCMNQSGGLPSGADCGFCCCKPGETNGALTCIADQGVCGGATRGLFCGCKDDAQCGVKDSQGCGFDTCCHARPQIVKTSPVNNAESVCRNSQIVIDFNQTMSVDTLTSNILLIEEKEYGKGTCSEGTLVMNDNFVPKNTSLLARVYRQIKYSWQNLFSGSNSAMAALPREDKLYCLAPSIITAEQSFYNGATTTKVYLRPQKIMTANNNYFVVVKGDKDLNSNFGVMSEDKVGFNATTSPIVGFGPNSSIKVDVKFNNTSFPGSYIFNFKTMDSKDGENGLCVVNKVEVNPVSFLVKTSVDDASDNDYQQISTFDKQSDSDRLLAAHAYSIDGQILQPVTSYFWDWQWNIENTTVASWANVAGLPLDKKVVVANDKITDNSTKITAKVVMDNFSTGKGCKASPCTCVGANCSNNCCNISLEGNGINGASEMYVFLCANPWPVEKNGLWTPWADLSFDKDGKPVINHNYKFYYCRDAGEPGTADDLPAIDDSALILGANTNFFCSDGGAVCSQAGAACGPTGSGVCVWSVLKESYFFRTAIPQSGEVTEVKDTGAGGQVQINWYSPAALVSSYKIYYGPTNGNTSTLIIAVTPQTACQLSADKSQYVCTYKVNKLVDDQKYSFLVSSVSDKKTESPLFGGKEVTPTDKTAPAIPQGITASATSNTTVKVTWAANTDDTLYYKVYHGLSAGRYGESFSTPDKATSMILDTTKYVAGNHFFAVTALDKKDNQSVGSAEVMVTISK
ncbi:MAG: IPT/TIG domain-containing protein [Patescibacteria group bacterium]